MPDIQQSFKDGKTQISKGDIVSLFRLKSFSLKEERKVKNLAFLVGKTMFPLKIKQIRYKFFIS